MFVKLINMIDKLIPFNNKKIMMIGEPAKGTSIYHDLELMKQVALDRAKAHNCNYNIILMNPKNGVFDEAAGSTYEMVADSYFEKERPNVILLHKTNDLLK